MVTVEHSLRYRLVEPGRRVWGAGAGLLTNVLSWLREGLNRTQREIVRCEENEQLETRRARPQWFYLWAMYQAS